MVKIMNELDVIESLKQKEEELDNLLNEAREKAAHIKKDAFRRAEEIRLSMSKELDAGLEGYKKQETEKIEKEVEAIKATAVKKAEELRLVGEQRLEKAVEMVAHYILGGKR